jgi:hypothetical protein
VLASSLAKRAPGYTSLGFPDPGKLPYTPSTAVVHPVVLGAAVSSAIDGILTTSRPSRTRSPPPSSESGGPAAMSCGGSPILRPDVAVRIICWFPANDQIVLALVGFDKKSIGDVFYASAAARGEAIVDVWLRQKRTSHD